jgi:predicted ester cyclase
MEASMNRVSQSRLKLGLMAIALLSTVLVTGCQEQMVDATVAGQASRNIMMKNVEIYNTGNVDLIESIISPNYVGHFSSMETVAIGLDAFTEWVLTNRAAYSDFRVGVDKIIVEGNLACLQWTVTGTNDGPMSDRGPTGKQIRVQGLTLARIESGMIVEEWITWDVLDMYRQLGYTVVPPKV